MYIPSAFIGNDLNAVHEVMTSSSLANMITAISQGLSATAVPLRLAPREGDYSTLYGHLARANLQWAQKPTPDALAIFMGPDAYISPSYYPSKKIHHKMIPNWDYNTICACGPIALFDDEEKPLDVVRNPTKYHKNSQPQPLNLEDAPKDFIRPLLKGIIDKSSP